MAHNPGTRTRRDVSTLTVAALVAALGAALPARTFAQERGSDPRSIFNSIEWTWGEKEVDIGNIGEFTIPDGCRYTDAAGARTFLELTQNPPSGREQGLLFCGEVGERTGAKQPWFVVFTFDPSGYVRDDDRKELDAGKILAAIREGTEAANRIRKAQGWEELKIDGWVRAPYYDPATHNLTWSTKATATESGTSVNHSVRLLGRRGVMHVDLVAEPEQLDGIVGTFDTMIASTRFLAGHKYSEWRKGDKVAGYGLTALVAGGAGAAAVKLGLFAKLGKLFGKLGKLVVAAVVGALAGLRALFRRRKEATA